MSEGHASTTLHIFKGLGNKDTQSFRRKSPLDIFQDWVNGDLLSLTGAEGEILKHQTALFHHCTEENKAITKCCRICIIKFFLINSFNYAIRKESCATKVSKSKLSLDDSFFF